jgi:hypothetical protein
MLTIRQHAKAGTCCHLNVAARAGRVSFNEVLMALKSLYYIYICIKLEAKSSYHWFAPPWHNPSDY